MKGSIQAPDHGRIIAGRWLCLAGVIIAAAVFLAALPIQSFGIFNRLEIVIITLLAAAAIACAGLALVARQGNLWSRAATNPAAMVLFGLGAWSLVAAPLAELPWRSLTGPPQTGQGGLMMLGLAAIAAATAVLRPSRLGYMLICAAAVLAAWTATIQHLVPAWQVFDVPAYYAVLALAVFGLVAALPMRPGRAAALGAVMALPPLIVSENRSAMLIAVFVTLPVYVAVRWACRHKPAEGLRRLRIGVAAATVAATAAGMALLSWLGRAEVIVSMTARARINDAMWAALTAQPTTLLWGLGWGGTSDAFLRYLRAANAILWDESWDTLGRDFHSAHSLALEFLMSTGLVGLVAELALVAFIPLLAPRRLLPAASAFALSFAVIFVFWYQQSFTLGVTAVACAALAPSSGRFFAFASRRVRPAASALAIALSAILAGLAIWLVQYGIAVDRAYARASTIEDCGGEFPADAARGDLGLRYALYQALVEGREKLEDTGALDPADIRRIVTLTCATDRRLNMAPSLHLAFSAVVTRGEVATTPALFQSGPATVDLLATWPQKIRKLLQLAPQRTDMAVPYLAWLAGRGEFVVMRDFAEELLRLGPDDVVGLWFSGLGIFRAGGPQEAILGAQRMARALSRGFDRVLPVPEDFRKELNSINNSISSKAK